MELEVAQNRSSDKVGTLICECQGQMKQSLLSVFALEPDKDLIPKYIK